MLLVVATASMARADDPSPVPGDAVPSVPNVDPNPCPPVNQTAGSSSCDSQFTPVAKDGSGLFTQFGGARFSETKPMAGSFTPVTVDFYAVRFFDQNNGFAGGAACQDPDTAFGDLGSCERVPVIWQYTNKGGEGPLWRQVYRGDTKGFVAAIAYYGRGKAMAVGGSGRYPYREFSNDTTSAADSDASGRGRIWEMNAMRFQDSDWHEYGADQKPTAPNLPADPAPIDVRGLKGKSDQVKQALPDPVVQTPMRALTAIDCSQLEEFCVAGGLQQLFMWHNGRVDKSYGNGSPDSAVGASVSPTTSTETASNEDYSDQVRAAINLRFRVRALRFMPGEVSSKGRVAVVGVTSGCCDLNPANNVPRMVIWDNSRWYVMGFHFANPGDRLPESVSDSFYSLAASPGPIVSILGAQGGPERPVEPASRIMGPIVPTKGSGPGAEIVICGAALAIPIVPALSFECTDLPSAATKPDLSDMRLVAGDGDTTRPPTSAESLSGTAVFDKTNEGTHIPPPTGPDGFMDWAVGVRRASGQGVAYTSTINPNADYVPSPLNCASAFPDQGCQAGSADDVQRRLRSQARFLLPSYGLNGFALVGSTGIGWAVGDKGALVRLGGSGDDSAVLPEPKPPRVGPAKRGTASPSGSFQELRPAGMTDHPGQLPALGSRLETKPTPELVPAGSPQTYRQISLYRDDVNSIVMSRDGSEGWALGSGLHPTGVLDEGRTTLYHYQNSQWTRCDPLGVSEELAADAACKSLSPLLHYINLNHKLEPVRLIAATRVPLENDADPSNDDEFEVMAVGTQYVPPDSKENAPRPAVIVYRHGRWSLDETAMREITPAINLIRQVSTISFAAPDDGWLTDSYAALFHYDGHHWVKCDQSPAQRASCGDDPAAPILPDSGQSSAPLRLYQAGLRTYLYGSGRRGSGPNYPVVLYKDPGGHWTGGAGDGTGYDPGCVSRNGSNSCVADQNAERGRIDALSVVPHGGGSFSGWAAGAVDKTPLSAAPSPGGLEAVQSQKDFTEATVTRQVGTMLRLTPSSAGSGNAWRQWVKGDATSFYPDKLMASDPSDPPQLVITPSAAGGEVAYLLPRSNDGRSNGPALWFNPSHGRWEIFRTPFHLSRSAPSGELGSTARGRVLAPDGQGGAWLAVRRMAGEGGFHPKATRSSVFFYHYTNQVPKPVFEDVPNPAAAMQIVGAAGGGDGSFWLATNSGTVFRHDRATGWDRLAVPGWDPGRLVTKVSTARAIAVGADGNGILVGDGGRIADLSPSSVILDPAAGRSCGRGDPPPCGTGRNLTAAAVAPNGSALIGGEARVVFWRGPGGDFRAIAKPPAALSATITSISMPTPSSAWLTTDHGEVFTGLKQADDQWQWTLENDTPDGAVLNTTLDGQSGEAGEAAPLNAVAVDADGFGFAVGENGLVLQRSGNGDHPWRRLGDLPVSNFGSVTIAPGGHRYGALIGGDYGLILALQQGHLAVAHQGDPWDGVNTTRADFMPANIAGLAMVPGIHEGELEAWAVNESSAVSDQRSPTPNALLHYSSDPSDPLLDGSLGRGGALPDEPPARAGELRIGAFGKSDCAETLETCAGSSGARLQSDLIPHAIAAAAAGRDGSALDLTLFTGDAVQTAGVDKNDPSLAGAAGVNGTGADQRGLFGIADARPPLAGDHTDASVVHRAWADLVANRFSDAGAPFFGAIGGEDLSTIRVNRAPQTPSATNLGYRQAMAPMPAPWGTDPKPQSRNGITWQPAEDNTTKTANDATQASTHYAVDGIRDGRKILRLVVADTSRGSLTASDPLQNPPETQSAWLEKLLCIKGSQADTGNCTRQPDQQAILMTETPTYSYGPGGLTDVNNQDGAAIEALVFKDKVNAVIQGKLGWNGLYWASTQGVHTPQPGGDYPSSPPAPVNGASPVPFIVASGAGGKFAADAQSTPASAGYWHGYTLIRLSPDGDPAKTIVEQRPILDWLLIQAKSHMLRPHQSLKLQGLGREPVSTDTPIRYDEISGPAITHCYDLVLADPEKPWLPLKATDASQEQLDAAQLGGCQARSGSAEPSASSEGSNPCDPYVC
ncbi:MAG: hypothetical protein QOJ38_466, partial [Solirubrobacterales bacterium]|nr:hypothetical protein [Solirubrobacterales bacterium]